MGDYDLADYFREQQVSLQWLPVLRAMAVELSAQADDAQLRQVFFSIGQRFATDAQALLTPAQSLPELEAQLNDFWRRINWGWVVLSEEEGFVAIVHQASPLAEAFGEDSFGWSVGLLEGFYQHIFMSMGADAAMRVVCIDEGFQGMDLRLRLGLDFA